MMDNQLLVSTAGDLGGGFGSPIHEQADMGH